MTSEASFKKNGSVVLCILDGWGEGVERRNNAVALAKTPTWDRLTADWPKTTLDACAGEVGLPDGQMGNSEVGHMNIGAGRVVTQDLPRIDHAIARGALETQGALPEAIAKLRVSGGAMHLMGLVSPGGVHSHQDHMVAIAKIFSERKIPVRVHAFLDGRDTPPAGAKGYLGKLENDMADLRDVSVATATGRYFAMDRDNRWERVDKAARAIRLGEGREVADLPAAVQDSYDQGVTDEFVEPIIREGYQGLNDGDGLMMANFRADRAREILSVLADPDFDDHARPTPAKLATCVGLTEYSRDHNRFVETVFPPKDLNNVLGQVVADRGLKQLRIAETEKYAHVTFFLNGGRERVFEGEERILVPSPKVATYDLRPEMSALEVTDRLLEALESETFDLLVVNYANGDMVGHTGKIDAAIKAAETLDGCLERLEAAVLSVDGTMLVTADHGNLECMRNPDSGESHTAHTLNVVPLVLVNGPKSVAGLKTGRLADLAPTVLALMGVEKPADMTGRCLLLGDEAARRAVE